MRGVVGPYRLVREVARGGMGVVYEAQAPDGARVALKVLATPSSPHVLARFDRERRLLAELSSTPGFVPLLDAGEAQGRPWIVMPFMAGGSLRDRLDRGPLSVDAAVALGRRLGTAIGQAHARGIVHRDLKPENVLFERAEGDLEPAIADLGVAKHFRRDGLEGARSASLSRSGTMLGTACYMAPEQLQDARAAGPPADVFALAQIVYECVAGVTPFVGESLDRTLVALIEGRPVPLRERVPGAPAWLDAVLARALAPDPLARPADGVAFARELARGPRGAPSSGRSGARRALAAAAGLGGLAGALVVGMAWPTGAPRAPSPSSPSPSDGAAAERAAAEGDASEARDTPAADEGRVVDEGDALLARVQAALERGRVQEALADAEAALARRDDATTRLARGVALLRAGRREDGLADLERAAARSPSWTEPWARLAYARLLGGEHEAARAAADRALALTEGHLGALRTRGLAHLALGDPARARDDLERYAAALAPGLGAGDLELGAALARLRSSSSAASAARHGHLVEEARLAVAAGDRERARALCDQVLAESPDHARALALRSLTRSGSESDADLDRSIELAPESWALETRAHRRVQAGDLVGARDDLDRALALPGRTASALLQRASLRQQLGDAPGALTDAREAVALDPAHADAWLFLARTERWAPGSVEGALEAARRATELAPGSGPAWAERGTILLELRRFAEAIPALSRALELATPDGVPELLCARARAFFGARRGPEGVRDLERCVALAPSYGPGWTWLADARLVTGQLELARAAADRALQADPDDALALRTRGLVRLELGDPAGARDDLERARALDGELFARDRVAIEALERAVERLDRAR